MFWNVTKDGVRTRMAVANREGLPTPPLAEKIIDKSNSNIAPDFRVEMWAKEATPVVEQIYKVFNEEHGTSLSP